MRLVPLAAADAALASAIGQASPSTSPITPAGAGGGRASTATRRGGRRAAANSSSAIAGLGACLTSAGAEVGVKAARLGAALRAGLPVLPGWVVPVGEGESARLAGAEAVRANGVGAGRVAVLGRALDVGLVAELEAVVDHLGGTV